MFSVDIETCGFESNVVLLSAAVIYFDPDKDWNTTYEQFLERSITVKVAVLPQVAVRRRIEKDTVDWWIKQSTLAKDVSFNVASRDLMPLDAINYIREYINTYRDPNVKQDIFWARGSLEQMVLDSFCRSFKQPPFCQYWEYRDFRTALDLLGFDESKFSINSDKFIKHVPSCDAALDLIKLISCYEPF